MGGVTHETCASSDAVVARVIALVNALPEGSNVAVTGGRVGQRINAAIVNQSRIALNLWFSDERFLPSSDPGRNDFALPSTATISVHSAQGPERAASAAESALDYETRVLAAIAERGLPLAVLSVGDDGHVASLFPGSPVLAEAHAGAVAILNSPKPPPQRVTWTLPLINTAEHVLVIAAGSEKSEISARVLGGDVTLPAALVHGRQQTTVLSCP